MTHNLPIPKPLWAVENNLPDLTPDYHKTIEVLQYYFDLLGSRKARYDSIALNNAIFLAGLKADKKTWAWFRFCIDNFDLYFNLAPIDQSVMED